MPKTGDTCTYSGYYKFSGHAKDTTKYHPSFDEISMQMFEIFPPIHKNESMIIYNICIKYINMKILTD